MLTKSQLQTIYYLYQAGCLNINGFSEDVFPQDGIVGKGLRSSFKSLIRKGYFHLQKGRMASGYNGKLMPVYIEDARVIAEFNQYTMIHGFDGLEYA